ncbi:MAG: alpha-L-fucosidase [Clostridia bacterium]|nr:alpha-L-fucosidase [Clostridia bacterium]
MKKEIICPNERQKEWFRRGMTAFLHFNMNTFNEQEWSDGTDSPKLFNPTELDCRQWIKVLKDAGFGTAILTAKHHDGFCLWPSAYTDYTVKNSPYKDGKGDIVREFTDACKEFGVKAGLYLSPWDRHEKTWGKPEYSDFYANQLTELLTNYGTIWEIWWDGAGSTEAVYEWDRWANLVRTLQPNAVIFGSFGAAPYVDVRWAGNERGYAGKPCWATVDRNDVLVEIVENLNSGNLNGDSYIPAEVDVSIRPGWFYKKSQDEYVRPISNLLELYFCSIGRNAGLLLNVPPDKRGLIADVDIKAISGFSAYLKKNLSVNLLDNATVIADDCFDGYDVKALTDGKEETYYKSKTDCPVIEYTFDKETLINTVILEEMIDFGHRIIDYTVSALVDGEWKELFTNTCLGNCCIEQFSVIKASKIRLNVNKSLDKPCLRTFKVCCFEELPKELCFNVKGKNLLSNSFARTDRNGDVIHMNLGGVFPFNTIKIDGKGLNSYDVRIFNGLDFSDPITIPVNGEDLSVFRFDNTIDYAYSLEITLHETVPTDNIRNVAVLYE